MSSITKTPPGLRLSKANIKLDRKSLAGIAFSDPDTFKKIVEKVRV